MTKFYETMFGLSLDYDTPLNYSNFPNQIWLTVGWNLPPLGLAKFKEWISKIEPRRVTSGIRIKKRQLRLNAVWRILKGLIWIF